MTTRAKERFDANLDECAEALRIYDYLRARGYEANFGLRFVWVAAVSAVDHYVTELIVERAVKMVANKEAKTDALLAMHLRLDVALAVAEANPIEAVVIFQRAIEDGVRFRSFQKAEDVAGGLSLVWAEDHKWQKIAEQMGEGHRQVREKLNNIVARRNGIAHNADYDEVAKSRSPVEAEDAAEVVRFLKRLVEAIDRIVQD